jgi:hypothetical protein
LDKVLYTMPWRKANIEDGLSLDELNISMEHFHPIGLEPNRCPILPTYS